MGNASEMVLFISSISKNHDILMGTLYSMFCVLSLLGNGTLLFVAYRRKSFLKPAEFFIVNLSISDLGMTLTLFPLAIPSAFAHRWLFDNITCLCYAFCGVLFGLCSLTNLTILSSVCCLKVCYPAYGNKFSSAHAGLLVVFSWCYSSVFAWAPLAKWGHYGPEPYGTACCIDWHAAKNELSAMTYIVSLFVFCYVVPCTIIFTSYAFILLTVWGSRQAVQQHVSPVTKAGSAHNVIIKLSIAVCIGFLTAWSPYAIVSMWAAFGDSQHVPSVAFAMAAIFAKSSTIYNPIIYLLFKPNFRKFLCRDAAVCRRRVCTPFSCCRMPGQQKEMFQSKDVNNSTWLSNGQPENNIGCHRCPDSRPVRTLSANRTAQVTTSLTNKEVPVTQLSDELKKEFL
uniref:Opsin 7, group member b n=1 Tax=Erpetoichthys calabaricus TaxID=27687 RepID=A0A8C4X7R6_ERPCA